MKGQKYYAYFLLGKAGLPAGKAGLPAGKAGLLAGRQGICESWSECEKIVSGKNARFRSFNTRKEAEEWLVAGGEYEKRIPAELKPGIYFDAGTGGGQGVEISVTDENGRDLLDKVLPRFVKGVTNNYGELLACDYALQLALENKIKKIFGDSKLVVDFWSRGFFKKDKLNKKTIDLIGEVFGLRKKFEKGGGEMLRVSGDDNPADLGFHR